MNNNNKRLQNENYKLGQKVKNLQEALNDVKSDLSTESFIEVSDHADQIPPQLLKLFNNKLHSGKGERKYDETIRKFSLSLHMKSASAYRYVKKCFGDALPCESTLRSWCKKIDCSLGSTSPH